MNVILAALCLSLTLDGVLSECPKINDLPVLNDAGDRFYCAWYWYGFGSTEPIDACNGDQWHAMDDEDRDVGPDQEGWYWPTGSIIVKAGCTFYGYENNHWSGELIKYYGPATFPDGCTGGNCPPYEDWDPDYVNGFGSYKCRCEQDPIICQPTDDWRVIIQCDNTQSSVETLCSYTKTIGTTWSSSAQESMSIDTTIEYAMHAGFFNMFSEDLSISETTGYDWTHVSSQAQSETETFQVEAKVPPYTLLQIQGAEGDCGGNNVKTELFRTITMDRGGSVLSEIVEKFDPQKEGAKLVNDTKELNME